MSESKSRRRLFFALWPDRGLRNSVNHVVCELPEYAGQRHHPDDLHITLVFLGAVAVDQRACVERVGDEIEMHPFILHLDRVEYWQQPQTLCLCADDKPAPLMSLVQQLQSGLADCGFTAEKRVYTPHVTLARKVKKWRPVKLDFPIEWPISEFVLAGASTGKKPPRYQVIKRWPLVKSR